MLASLTTRVHEYDKESYFGDVYPKEHSALTVWKLKSEYPPYLEMELFGRRCDPREYWSLGNRQSIDWAPNSTMIAHVTGVPWFGDPRKHSNRDYCGMSDPGVIIWGFNQTHIIPITNMTGPVRPVNTVQWSPDCSMLAAGSQDGTIRVWKVGPPQEPEDPQPIGAPATIFIGILIVAITIDVYKTLHKK
jgi:WD40 repeat protein